jgi:hypothetical protein
LRGIINKERRGRKFNLKESEKNVRKTANLSKEYVYGIKSISNGVSNRGVQQRGKPIAGATKCCRSIEQCC